MIDASTVAIRNWLDNHQLAIQAGMNVGQLDRDKAHKFRLELIRRSQSHCTVCEWESATDPDVVFTPVTVVAGSHAARTGHQVITH